jgi:hypothetical protein
MPELVLKKGGMVGGVSMVFPEGGLSDLTDMGMKVAFSVLTHGSPLTRLVNRKNMEALYKAVWGGIAVPGTLYLYDDRLRFECEIPKLLVPLYRDFESVSVDYSQIKRVTRKTLKLIYPAIDIELEKGLCRILAMWGTRDIYDTLTKYCKL